MKFLIAHPNLSFRVALSVRLIVCRPDFETNEQLFFSPWRAPGSSPVFDACGMAGWSSHQKKHEAVDFDASTRQAEPTPGAIMELSTGVVFLVNWLQEEFLKVI